MKTTIKTGLSAAMAVAMFATSFVTAPAFAMPLPKADVSQTSNVEQVQYYGERRERRGWHGGYRGYRHERHGYRRHSDGWWYPLAAFGLGAAIIGGMAAQQAPRPPVGVAMPVSHVRWCQGRYRSYDAYTNTFQPYNGPRQVCVSPYYR